MLIHSWICTPSRIPPLPFYGTIWRNEESIKWLFAVIIWRHITQHSAALSWSALLVYSTIHSRWRHRTAVFFTMLFGAFCKIKKDYMVNCFAVDYDHTSEKHLIVIISFLKGENHRVQNTLLVHPTAFQVQRFQSVNHLLWTPQVDLEFTSWLWWRIHLPQDNTLTGCFYCFDLVLTCKKINTGSSAVWYVCLIYQWKKKQLTLATFTCTVVVRKL